MNAPKTWTREAVLANPNDEYATYPPEIAHEGHRGDVDEVMDRCGMTREAAEAAVAEQHWNYTAPYPTMPPDLVVPTALRKISCPVCHDNRYHSFSIPVHGDDTGLDGTFSFNCICPLLREVGYIWAQYVPKHHESAPMIRHLEPTDNPQLRLATPPAVQQSIIDRVKKHRDKNLLLVGGVNGGKSYIAYSLWKDRVWACYEAQRKNGKHPPTDGGCWAINVRQLLDEQFTWSTGKSEKKPTVTAEKVKKVSQLGWRPMLLIDELDKFSVTPARLDFLFDLVAAIYDCDGQVISTSNLTLEQLSEKWKSDEGDALLSRLGDRENGRIIDFDAEIAKWQQEQAA